MVEYDDRTPLLGAELTGPRAEHLVLVVVQEGVVEMHALPTRGRVVIGRGEGVDVHIEDALLSREHVRLTVSPEELSVEDLGSRNGTKLRGVPLQPRERRVLAVGQVIELGSVSLVVQPATTPRGQRRLATHAHFEGRLEEACARGKDPAVLRIQLSRGLEAEPLLAALDGVLRPPELAACYAPGEYELLLLEASAERVQEVEKRLAARLPGAALSSVVCPRDGRTAQALLEASSRAARDPELEEAPPVILDPVMRDLYAVGERVARGNISVLILGETGAGKEVFAEALHRTSPRKDGPFVRLNCAAFAETLLESELFGHEKGAFTGAVRAKPGQLELADGGTILLDELGEMPPATQAKLLRVLEQREVMRVGATEARAIDVRFLSATNRDLEAEVLSGRFRRDLYYRLNGVTLAVPPLRERPLEILPLARRFARSIAEELGLPEAPPISPRAEQLLLGYDWPGNVRELKNVMERALLLSSGSGVEPEHLPTERMASFAQPRALGEARPGVAPAAGEEEAEKRRIAEALERCGGNQTRAAKLLGIGRRTLTAKLTRYNMPRPRR